MTVMKGDPSADRRTHVPDAGTTSAEAVEKARRDMLHEGRVRKRTRIGADVVCEAILRQGVDVLFGYPGGVILPLYDVFGDYPELRHILVRHEQGAAHAADGFARATGRVGVCLGTSGPGATNLVTGIATAQLDSIPLVAITGNVPAALLGKDAFQEIDITGITLPMTKHNYLVRDANELPRVLAEAFTSPGPVARARSTSTSRRTRSSRRPAPSIRARRRSSRGCPASARPSMVTRASSGPSHGRSRTRSARSSSRATGSSSPRRGMSSGSSPRRRASPSRGRSSGSAPSTRPIHSRTGTWGCTAGST